MLEQRCLQASVGATVWNTTNEKEDGKIAEPEGAAVPAKAAVSDNEVTKAKLQTSTSVPQMEQE